MKITSLNIEGFRSLRSVTWEPGDLNVVIGPNGAGKSNLLQVLQLISRAAEGQLSRTVQAAGGMGPLVWDGRADHIAIRLQTSPPESMPDPVKRSLTYQLRLARLGQGGSYRIDHELLVNSYRVEAGKKPEPFKYLERTLQAIKVLSDKVKFLAAPVEALSEEETVLSALSGPFGASRFIPLFQAQLAAWCVYQDLHVNQDSPIRQPTVTRNEKRVNPDGQNLVPVLHTLYTTDRDFKRNVNKAMGAAFGEDFEELVFPPAGDQRIQMRVRWRTLRQEQSAADLSDGTLRFLFLLTVLASPDPAPLIAVDEPETGLHPAMLPIVAEYAVAAARRTQIIFTTHSPQFLDAFGEIRPQTTVARWTNGETTLTSLPPDQLEYWLKDYSLGALFRSGELEDMA